MAIVSPGMTTVPSETGTLSTRPVPGARTAPCDHLLFDDLPVRKQRLKGAFGDIETRPRLVQLGLRRHVRSPQLLNAVEIDLRLISIGLLSLNARLKALHLQQQLLVGDHGDVVACVDPIAFLDGERCDCSPDAGPGEKLTHRLDSGDHSLAVIDLQQPYSLFCGETGGPEGTQTETSTGHGHKGDAGRNAGHGLAPNHWWS